MRQHSVMNLEGETAVRAHHEFPLATAGWIAAGEIDDHMRARRNLAVHPDADILYAIAAHADVALRRRHYGVGKVDDNACRRFER